MFPVNKKTRSTILLILTAAMWGSSFVAYTVGSFHLGALTFTAVRFILGSLSMIPVVLLFEKQTLTPTEKRATLKGGLLVGLVLAAASIVQQYAVAASGSAGISSFISNLYTVFTPILCFFLFKKNPGKFAWLGFVVALAGLYLLSGANGLRLGKGEVLLLITALGWAIHLLAVDYAAKSAPPLRATALSFCVAAVLSSVAALFLEDCTVQSLLDARYAILFGGIISVGASYTCQALGQKDADPNFAALIYCLDPVFAALGGALILHEVLPSRGYIGCALILCGILLSRIPGLIKKEDV